MQNSAVWQFSLNALHAAAWGGSLLVALVVFVRYLSLPVAVAHNGVAALLLAVLVMLNFAAYPPSSFR